jgi:hypothetical protein
MQLMRTYKALLSYNSQVASAIKETLISTYATFVSLSQMFSAKALATRRQATTWQAVTPVKDLILQLVRNRNSMWLEDQDIRRRPAFVFRMGSRSVPEGVTTLPDEGVDVEIPLRLS